MPQRGARSREAIGPPSEVAMARRKIKSPADIRPALARGAMSEDDRRRVVQMGPRALPELLAAALDPAGTVADDPATLLAQALVEAIGLPVEEGPGALEQYLSLPETADVLPRFGLMVTTAGPRTWELAARRAQEVTSPILAERLGWVLLDAEGEDVGAALRQLARAAPERLAWVLVARADPALLPELDHCLAHLSVPLTADADAYDAIHQLVVQARDQGADPARCLMLMQALVERIRMQAEEVVIRRGGLPG